jgi:hypothetical protein
MKFGVRRLRRDTEAGGRREWNCSSRPEEVSPGDPGLHRILIHLKNSPRTTSA